MRKKIDNINFMWKRLILIFISAVSLLLAVLIYLNLSNIGFPDGYKTEYDRIKELIYPFYIGFYILSFLFFLIYASICGNSNNSKLKWSLVAFLVFTFIAIILNCYFAESLNNGVGG